MSAIIKPTLALAVCALILSGFVPAANAAAPETAAHFIQRVSDIYKANSEWWAEGDTPAQKRADAAYTQRVYAQFYDPVFARLIQDNSTLAAEKNAGEDLDYDPVCQCQDSGGTYSLVSIAPHGSFFYARIKGPAAGQIWTLVLTHAAAGYRIYDVLDETGDVRARLIRHNACLEAAKTEAAADKCIA